MTAKDGSVYKTPEAPAAGVEIMQVTTDGESPAPDGDIEMEDGQIISVKDGKITEVKASPMGPDPMTSQQMKAILAGIDPTGKSTDPIHTMLRALMEANFGWEIRNQEQQTTRDAAIQAYKAQMSSQESSVVKLRAELQAVKDARKTDNEQLMAAFEATLSAIQAVAKAPIGGEDQKQNFFPKTTTGGPLGRKANQ